MRITAVRILRLTGTMRTEGRLRQVAEAAAHSAESSGPILAKGPGAAPGSGLDPLIDAFYGKADQIMDSFRDGTVSAEAAAAAFRKLFADVDFIPPSFGLTDMTQPYFDIDMAKVASAVDWARRARPGIRELYLGGLPAT